MAVYFCKMCGYEYDEAKEGIRWEDLPGDWGCPVCGADKSLYSLKEGSDEAPGPVSEPDKNPLAYPGEFFRQSSDAEPHMDDIHRMALDGRPIIEPMGTRLPCPSWDDILFLGAQLDPLPLEDGAAVSVRTVIGKRALKPLVIENPVYVSHMSFGALSREMKIALAKGSALAGTATCSGEGGILPDEMIAAYRYIFEYVPNLYSVTPENLRSVDAIEIKIGQGTKPGMGGHLPAEKVTEEIARIRNKPMGRDIISPSKFERVKTRGDLKALVSELREASGGRPIGVKLAAGHIERDLDFAAFSEPDFITLDGRGGATGASPKTLKDASAVPTIYALYRAKRFLGNSPIDIVITGGLRVPSDFVKAIAMGADAVAIASAALMAAACQQYRVCHTGMCPVGAATQDESLRARLSIDSAARRLANFLAVTKSELETFCRVSGHSDIHELSVSDLCTVSREISEFTDILHI